MTTLAVSATRMKAEGIDTPNRIKSEDSEDIGSTVIGFGKHIGRSYSWVALHEPDYCDFILHCDKPTEDIRNLRSYLITLRQYGPISRANRETLGFGRHCDKTYGWVILNDSLYSRWALRTPKAVGALFRFQNFLKSSISLTQAFGYLGDSELEYYCFE